MRVISQERVSVEGFLSITPVIAAIAVIFIFFMAILMIFRQQCINEGYKISMLANELDAKSLRYEAVSSKYSDALRWESLFLQANDMGFEFPVGGRVFYVQQ
ncbi:MAG: hypothetical protein K2N67_04125 [Mucispirillum sp.]|nr:hypothetical protein [Mucispirillum sp.]